MPTATYPLGAGVALGNSGAAAGGGYGTGAYQTADAAYNPTSGRRVVLPILGLTNNAAGITGGTVTATDSGGAATLSQHPAGWVGPTDAGWMPFCTAYYYDAAGATNLRVTCDATDSIYQWVVGPPIEYSGHDTSDFWGPWGSDLAVADTADNEVTTLDQDTSPAIQSADHVVGLLAMDGNGGAVAPGADFTERYEGPSGGGQTALHVQDDQTTPDNTCEWGAVTPTIFSWVTLAFTVRDGGGAAAASLLVPQPHRIIVPFLNLQR